MYAIHTAELLVLRQRASTSTLLAMAFINFLFTFDSQTFYGEMQNKNNSVCLG